MRLPALLIAAVFCLGWSIADAAPGSRPASSDSPAAACDVVKHGTPGLHGMCVAYCAPRDQSNVDKNDIASVRAAAPRVKFLERYRELMRDGDPDMPCIEANEPEPTGTPEPGPTLPTSCGCWSSEELQLIGADAGTVTRAGTLEYRCPVVADDWGIVSAEIYAGYKLGTPEQQVISSAFAYITRDDDTVQGCMFQAAGGTMENYSLQYQVEAEMCIQEIRDHCSSL